MRRLPPLNALRAFEAAARHLSFTRAAAELSVTQAAISHQVHSLEELLGQPLFRRFNRRLELTEAGRGYYPAISEAFDTLDRATRSLRQRTSDRLRITALQSFTGMWLLPRLPRFRALHPTIDVLISASDSLADLKHDDFDIGVRFGRGNYPGLKTSLLMQDISYPLCSPQLLKGPNGLRSPQDLSRHTLLHDDPLGLGIIPTWPIWFKTVGLKDFDASRGFSYSESSHALQAAIAGQGIVLGRWSLAHEPILSGQLVRPFGPGMLPLGAYYLAAAKHRWDEPRVQAFWKWMLDEASKMPAIPFDDEVVPQPET
jgi:LysR family glycine cleavage system transcriptional activator